MPASIFNLLLVFTMPHDDDGQHSAPIGVAREEAPVASL